MKSNLTALRTDNLVAFLAVFVVNMLAAVGLVNNITPGAVSDSYPNLFAPAGLTFAIWGVIYLLLALFVLYALGLFNGKTGSSLDSVRRIGPWFIISSAANVLWIFAWHFLNIPLSMALMAVILVSLIFAYRRIVAEPLTFKEKLFVRLPFSVYLGWITIATIANATVLLVSLHWEGFNLPAEFWTVAILIIGFAIGAAFVLRFKDVAYGLVLVWAYLGILIKHQTVWNGQYPGVINTLIILLIAGAIVILLAIVFPRKKQKA
jgi:hypothetical protein